MYRFQIFKDTAGYFRWRFVASNGQIVAVSGEGYTSKQSCQHGIQQVKAYAPAAPVDDHT